MAKAKKAEVLDLQVVEPQPVTPVDLVRIAADQGVDALRLRELYELQREWERDQAKKAYNQAMANLKAELRSVVERDKQGGQDTRTWKYASLAAAVEAATTLMGKHGLIHRWVPRQRGPDLRDNEVEITCVIIHKDGYEDRDTKLIGPYDGSGGKNPIQAVGSATAYLERYTFLAALGLAAGDQDDDGRGAGSPPPTPPPPPKRNRSRSKSEDPAPAEPPSSKPTAAYDSCRELIRVAQGLAELDRIDTSKVKHPGELEDLAARIDDRRAVIIGTAAGEADEEGLERLTGLLETVGREKGKEWARKKIDERRAVLSPASE